MLYSFLKGITRIGVGVMERSLAERMLNMVNDNLNAVTNEMKEIDRLYVSKQKEKRQLNKAKAELEEMLQGKAALAQ